MHTLNLWHLSVPIQYAVLLVAFLLALAVAAVSNRRGGAGAVVNSLFDLFWIGLLAARLGFVALYFDHYRDHLWSLINIRDGGFHWLAGLLGVGLALVYKFVRHPALRRPLLPALFAGLLSWGAMQAVLLLVNSARPPLPVLTFNSLEGGESQQLAEIAAGRPLVLNLWASWCPPCVREMPVLAKAQQQQPEVAFVFANQGENAATIAAFLARHNLALENVLLDPGHRLGEVTASRGLPTTLFYSAEGVRVHVHVGELSAATLAQGMALF